MSFKSLSIRSRLIIWNAVILMIILGVVFIGIFLFMQKRIETMVQNRVDAGFETVESVIRNSMGDIMDVYHLGHSPLFKITQDGSLVYRTQAWNDAPWTKMIDDEQIDPYGSWKTEDGRIFELRRGTVSEYNYDIVFAYDSTDTKASIKSLIFILITGIPLALALAVIGGYFLAGRALSPVKAITRKAREISAESLSERLPVANPHDEIGHLAGVFNQTLARLESSFDRLRRFTSDASHELRTPLTSIRSVGEVALQKSVDKNSCQEAIGSMLEETERLTHLVDNLLILARGDAGKTKLDLRPLDVSALVGEVVDELRVLAEEKKQILSTRFQSPIMMNVDESTLRHAISNILHNAVLYTQNKGNIEVIVEKGRDGNAIIDIMDNGPGIPESERSKVFERFYRIDKTRSKEKGGVGLGLAIAQWAVAMNGGTVEFLEKKDIGTHCRITLTRI
jgi:heavy metal sensor kinase